MQIITNLLELEALENPQLEEIEAGLNFIEKQQNGDFGITYLLDNPEKQIPLVEEEIGIDWNKANLSTLLYGYKINHYFQNNGYTVTVVYQL